MKLSIICYLLFFTKNIAIAQKVISLSEKSYLATFNNYYTLTIDSLSSKKSTYNYTDIIKIENKENKLAVRIEKNEKKSNIDIILNRKKINYFVSKNDNIDCLEFEIETKNRTINFIGIAYNKFFDAINILDKNEQPAYFIVYQKNLLIGRYKSKKDSFALCVSDYKLNGSYDEIYVMPYSTKKMDFEIYGKSSVNYRQSFFLKTNSSTYYLELVENNIHNLFFIKDSAIIDNNSYVIKSLDVMPNIILFESNNDTIMLHSLIGKKPILIDFWMMTCQPCLKKHSLIDKHYKILSEKFKIVSLNYSNNKTEILDYQKKNNYKWSFYSINETYKNEFNQNGFPFGLLFDINGNFLNYSMSFKQLLKEEFKIIE